MRCARGTLTSGMKSQSQLQHLRHERLEVDGRLLGVDSHAEVIEHSFVDVVPDLLEVAGARGQHVEVRQQDERSISS